MPTFASPPEKGPLRSEATISFKIFRNDMKSRGDAIGRARGATGLH